MANEVINDIVISLHGGVPSSRQTEESVRETALHLTGRDIPQYTARQKTMGQRNLNIIVQGVSDLGFVSPMVLRPTLARLAQLRTSGQKIGGVFITGCSIGTWYALLLADIVVRAGTAVTFIGLADMPLFADGAPGQ